MKHRNAYLLLMLASAAAAQPGGTLGVESVQRGTSPAIRSKSVPEFLVVRTPAEWAAAWKLPSIDQRGELSRPIEALPLMDFESWMIVGIILPTASDGCTSVTISRAILSNEQVEVKYRKWQPQPNALCTQSFTTAYHFVKVKRSLLPVVFAEEQ